MAQQFLEPAELALLADASEDGVLAAAIRLGDVDFPERRWLAGNNRYRDSVVSKINADTGSSGRTLTDDDMADYVAASGPLHCADGWAFLGRALGSHAHGDSDAARHLAYYAELRAAMSTLACSGIGIFDNKHIIVRSDGTVSWIRSKPSHIMTWLSLEYWAQRPTTAARLAELFRPQSVSIEDWVTSMPGGGSWHAIAADWLQGWGLDLSLFGNDRSARNESSYRPTRIAGRRSLDVAEAIEFLKELWLTFEPTGTAFARLDLHLLRRSLESIFRGTEGVPPSKKQPEWEAAVDLVLAANTDEGGLRDQLRGFLLRQDGSREIPLLRLAKEAGAPSEKDHHLRVMSRAALLLRVASGCCAQLLANAGLASSDVRFWWEFLGEDRGLWVPGGVPSPLSSLWADVDAALEDLDEITTNQPEAAKSYSGFLDACARPIVVLSGCERIGLWSLAA